MMVSVQMMFTQSVTSFASREATEAGEAGEVYTTNTATHSLW